MVGRNPRYGGQAMRAAIGEYRRTNSYVVDLRETPPDVFEDFSATDWSRINDDGHYLSQAVLGWWIAYLAVESVNRTEYNRNILVVPSCQPDEIGFRVLIQY